MKKYTIISLAILAALAAVSCNKIEKIFDEDPSAGKITLVLTAGESIATRSTTITDVSGETIPAEDFEKSITRFDWFIFKDAAGTTLLHHGFSTEQTELEFDTSEDSEFSDMAGTTYAYIIANYLDENGDPLSHDTNDWTLSELLGLKINSSLQRTVDEDENPVGPSPDGFVMDSYNPEKDSPMVRLAATQAQDGGAGTIEVPLSRIAAKIVVNVVLPSSVTDSQNEVWIPTTGTKDFKIYMVNANDNATVAGTPIGISDATTFQAADNYIDHGLVKGDDNLHWFMSASYEDYPFYTYPVTFDTGSNEAPYIKVQIPWSNVVSADDHTLKGAGSTLFYYKVYVPGLTSFERNNCYVINLEFDSIGGTPQNYVDVAGEYYVAEWALPADLSYNGYFSAKFLDIPEDVYYIYGDEEVTIPVISSHNISVSSGSGVQYDIDGTTVKNNLTYSPSTATGEYFTVTCNGKESFTLKHTLETSLGTSSSNANMDITAVEYVVTIRHDPQAVTSNMTDVVRIIQYPSIRIEQRTSTGNVWVNGYNSDNDEISSGYRSSSGGGGGGGKRSFKAYNNSIVSGTYDGTSYELYGYPLGHISGSSSLNPNLYIITVSNLYSLVNSAPAYSDFKIGDPRVSIRNHYPTYVEDVEGSVTFEINRRNQDIAVTYPGTWLEGDLPVVTESSAYKIAEWVKDTGKENLIAPRFMLASGHSTNSYQGNWKTNAERCASYQESGYPAGRWRLPTEAEVVFCRELSRLLYFGSEVFTSSAHYWTASGKYFYGQDFSEQEAGSGLTDNPDYQSGSVRCVYDLWYWGENPLDNNGNETTTSPATEWIGFHMD